MGQDEPADDFLRVSLSDAFYKSFLGVLYRSISEKPHSCSNEQTYTQQDRKAWTGESPPDI